MNHYVHAFVICYELLRLGESVPVFLGKAAFNFLVFQATCGSMGLESEARSWNSNSDQVTSPMSEPEPDQPEDIESVFKMR